MGTQYGILVDLDRCVGCYACEVACKQENSGRGTAPFIRVHTIGPAMVNGRLMMDFVPRISDRCTFCRARGLQPSCVAHCPTKALTIFSGASMLEALRSDRRYQACSVFETR